MSRDLVIVESPAKARTISRILGNDFAVQSSMGHIRDLPEKKLGVDTAHGFLPNYEIPKARRNIINELNKSLSGAETVYLATDPDREGEAIAWHLYELLNKDQTDTRFCRVTFHEITRPAVLQAFANPTTINNHLVNAQQARRVLDRIVGYKVSPLLWKQVNQNAKSAGRVQSVALRLICEREGVIRSFEPKEYWNFVGSFKVATAEAPFNAKLHQIDKKKVNVSDQEAAQAVHADVQEGKYRVAGVSSTPRKKHPSPPFITSTLQQAASSNLHFSANQTMLVAQQLYEGIDTGSGPSGLITYMRTDSVNISQTARDAARNYIVTNFGEEYVPEKPNVYKSKKGAQEAHEAIRPTDVNLTPDSLQPYLDRNQLNLYRLIWNRFLASQMAPAKQMQYKIEIANEPASCRRQYLFQAQSIKTLFPGYMKVYNLHDVEKEKGDDKTVDLPAVSKDESCTLKELLKEQKFTEPPPRFSEATLVRELENNGIGRPSTYAAIVNTIQVRRYVRKEKGRLSPTRPGQRVNKYLPDYLSKLFDVDFTAKMEDELDSIEQGKLDWQTMLDQFYNRFREWMSDIGSAGVPDPQAVNRLLSVIPNDFEWSTATTKGDRVYNDEKFFESIKKQRGRGRHLTIKQWHALVAMLVGYEDRLPALKSVVEEFALKPIFDEYREKRDRNRDQETVEVDENDIGVRLCQALKSVTDWQKVVGRNGRVYDDEKFCNSLSKQALNGRKLSDAQVAALKKLVCKYRGQIENFARINEELKLIDENETAETARLAEALLSMTDCISEWKAPKSGKRRKFDEKKFVESLKNQFAQKSQLSVKQLSTLKKIIGGYRDQIPDYETRLATIEGKS